jgi:hypothetical protein
VLPFEGSRLERGPPPASPPAKSPLMRSAALQSIVCSRLVGDWFPTPVALSPFLTEKTVCTDCRPPASCETGFILSYALRLYRVLPFRARPGSSRPEAPSLGLASLFATSACSVLRRASIPGAVRPRRFARPRRFDPLLALRVYFTPLPRPGFYPSGCSPLSTAEPIRHRSVPSRRLAVVAYERLPARASFHSPALRALLRAKSPLRLRRCYPTHRPFPSWACSSSRFSFFEPSRAPSCPLPLMTFAKIS